jgi:hypothetical protein
MRSSGTAVAEPDLDACYVAKAVASAELSERVDPLKASARFGPRIIKGVVPCHPGRGFCCSQRRGRANSGGRGFA